MRVNRSALLSAVAVSLVASLVSAQTTTDGRSQGSPTLPSLPSHAASPSSTQAEKGSQGTDTWDRVIALAPGQPIRVEVKKGRGRDLWGLYVASDNAGVTVRTKTEETLSREDIKKVKVFPSNMRARQVAAGIAVAVGVGVACAMWGTKRYTGFDYQPAIPGFVGLGVGMVILWPIRYPRTVYSAPGRNLATPAGDRYRNLAHPGVVWRTSGAVRRELWPKKWLHRTAEPPSKK